ncbi:MAG TPA: hypothetical protein VF188_06775 [Longimicrobiales bacterium]
MPRRTDKSRERRRGAAAEAAFEEWSRSLDLRGLAATYGTPLYIIDSNTLRENFARYVAVVGRADGIRYPVKANPSAAILEAIAALGGGADCASRDEVWLALEAGIPIERISYNSPAPESRLAVWLLRSGGTVVADSAEALADLREQLAGDDFAGRLFIRVSPGGLPGYRRAAEIHRYTAHGADDSPFGIPSEVVPRLLARTPMPVTGLHMHVGTQMDNVEAFTAALEFLHRLSDLVEARTAHRITTLNLGGGLGIPFLDGQRFPSIEALGAAIRPLRRAGLAYEVEPGNSLVGNAVALLARVVAIKTKRGRRWGILDVGTDQLVKFTIARWEHRIDDAEHRPLPREGEDALVGPLCFAGDVLLPATRLDGVKRGDPVLVRHAGAYCESVSSHFNGRRGPAHVIIEADGSLRLVRRAEDPFFQPGVQAHVPAAWGGTAPEGVPIDGATIEALHSRYMHEDAAADGYTILEARRVGERAYRFEVEPRAAVDFVAMPLALRIVGDAAIIAVGHVLGWRTKARPIWATRLSMSCGSVLPARGRVACRVAVGAPRIAPQPGVAYVVTVRFELGTGEVAGVARVVVPAASTAADAAA